jgi:hypothetical protein
VPSGVRGGGAGRLRCVVAVARYRADPRRSTCAPRPGGVSRTDTWAGAPPSPDEDPLPRARHDGRPAQGLVDTVPQGLRRFGLAMHQVGGVRGGRAAQPVDDLRTGHSSAYGREPSRAGPRTARSRVISARSVEGGTSRSDSSTAGRSPITPWSARASASTISLCRGLSRRTRPPCSSRALSRPSTLSRMPFWSGADIAIRIAVVRARCASAARAAPRTAASAGGVAMVPPPERSITPSTRPVDGSRIGAAAQDHACAAEL